MMLRMTVPAMILACAIASASAEAATVTVDLGLSAQNYVLYGQGAYAPGVGSFTNQQGSESYDAVANVTTDTLTGLISGSSDASLASGSYSFVTTYSGVPIGSGGTQIQSQSNPSNTNYFYYSFFDPSVNMALSLFTAGGVVNIPIVTSGAFDSVGFSFLFPTANCTGVAVCTQNDVGLTPGASEFGQTTISISFATAAVPEPATWGMMVGGFGLIGGAMRRRRKVATIFA